MTALTPILAGIVLIALATPVTAQVRTSDDDQITITGCVVSTPARSIRADRSLLVWSRGDIMLTGVSAAFHAGRAVGTSGRPGAHVFYWIDDEDDLAKHAGHQVEIVGEVTDELEKGELEIERKEDYTQIEFEWDGKEVTARVPTSTLGDLKDDVEYDIVVRRVDVEQVRQLAGPRCQ